MKGKDRKGQKKNQENKKIERWKKITKRKKLTFELLPLSRFGPYFESKFAKEWSFCVDGDVQKRIAKSQQHALLQIRLHRVKAKQLPKSQESKRESSKTRTAGFKRCDYLVVTYCSFSFIFRLRWTNRPTDRHFDFIFELSLTVSWCMSNFVVIGTSERTFFVVRK